MNVLIVSALYIFSLVIVEIVCRRFSVNSELSRKIAHIVSGLISASLPYFISFKEIAIIGFIFVPLTLVAMKTGILYSIHVVKRKSGGAVFFPLSILITALFFPYRLFYVYGVLILSVCDAAAGIVGQRVKSRAYSLLGSQKSYAGSAAFFVTAIVIGLFMKQTIGISMVVAGLLTVVEAGLSLGLDNLILAPVAALILLVLG
jgi:phytol kinase